MRQFIALLAFILILSSCQKEDPKTIYFVRHAEKDTLYPKDPALTIEGVMRSVDLAAYFKHIKVDTIFSSDYKRTKETAQPLSEKQGVGIGIYDPMDFESFAENLKSLKADTIVVVGHSNTLLPQMEALGAEKPQAEITEFEYNKLFEFHLGDKSVITHTYGSNGKVKKSNKLINTKSDKSNISPVN
jgi:broad specificity phosphatase PhoE